MKNVNWKIRLKAAGHKAAKAAAQTVTAAIGTAAIGKVNWVAVGSAAVVSILLSLMNSAASLEEEED